MVKAKSWRKTSREGGEAKKWCTTYRWHPDCWMEQAMKYVETAPIKSRGGRKKLDLTEEQRKARNHLLQRYALITFQQRKAAKKERPDLERILRLEVRRQEVIQEIRNYGPTPTKWTVGQGGQPADV